VAVLHAQRRGQRQAAAQPPCGLKLTTPSVQRRTGHVLRFVRRERADGQSPRGTRQTGSEPLETVPMTDAQMLTAIRSQALALMAQLTAQPKPSYTLDGQQVSWNDYLQQLRDTVAWCDRQLQRLQPSEVHTTGYTP
jgi:hypothetical protein